MNGEDRALVILQQENRELRLANARLRDDLELAERSLRIEQAKTALRREDLPKEML